MVEQFLIIYVFNQEEDLNIIEPTHLFVVIIHLLDCVELFEHDHTVIINERSLIEVFLDKVKSFCQYLMNAADIPDVHSNRVLIV